jgi:hypothetical protein
MPRFHFHVVEDGRVITDEEGLDGRVITDEEGQELPETEAV